MENKSFNFHSNPTTGLPNHLWVYKFRVGDIVTIQNWGKSYNYYPTAENYFRHAADLSYYAQYPSEGNRITRFKIKAIAIHDRYYDRLLAYVEDREKKGIIINMAALELVKQYPLRKGESLNINVEIIK